jgi:glycosyltransferase involved in cell wall biosynthesis
MGEPSPPWVIIAGGFHQKGGMDKANFALADYLLEREIPVHLVTHSVEPSMEKHPLATVHLVPRPGQSFLLGEFALALRGRKVAGQIVRQYPSAQVVVNGGNCVWPGVNWAHYVHHAWSAPRGGAWAYRLKDAVSATWARKTERAAFRRARLVITNSKRTSGEVVKYFGVDPDRVHAVYLGSDPAWGPISPEERDASRRTLGVSPSRALAAFVGGLGYDGRKGFDVLFKAWKILCARPDWDVDLVVAGGGPATPGWQTQILQSGLGERIRLLGFTDQVKSVLAASDLLISPVRYEAYGLNVQEAICRGVPAMVSASAGVAEQYEPGLAPMLIPNPDDAGDLVQRLLAWRLKKEEWRTRFQPMSERLRRRTWRDTALEFVSIVEAQGVGEKVYLPVLAGNSNS